MTMVDNLLRTPPLQEFMQAVALSVSAVVGLDVTIVDQTLVRVAGTGVYEHVVKERLPSSCSFGLVLGTGSPRLVVQPRADPECVHCEKREQCQETCHLAYPLLVDGRPIGVLSLVAFTAEQRQRIIDRQAEYSCFLRHMATLVAMAAHSVATLRELGEERDRLTGIVEAVREGILAI
ncbi:MAG TPA: hypothetical protein GX513_14120, partial [Firmicutes bacterium]|nr:hypothetical protein [Bacillota bacterium]